MRFEVPQFIEIEDKIVGPLTWKQFVYLAGGAGLLVVLFLLLPFFIFFLLAIPISGLSGFLAFHKVNNRPFSYFLEAAFYYFTNRKLYLWRRNEEQTIMGEKRQENFYMSAPPVQPTERPTSGSLASMSRKLELNTLQKQ